MSPQKEYIAGTAVLELCFRQASEGDVFIIAVYADDIILGGMSEGRVEPDFQDEGSWSSTSLPRRNCDSRSKYGEHMAWSTFVHREAATEVWNE